MRNLVFVCCGVVAIWLLDSSMTSPLTASTTGLPRDEAMPKPTSNLRRIYVGGRGDNHTQGVDLFQLWEQDFRRMGLKSDPIWNWDYWCRMQPTSGSCSKKLSRYYYNAKLDLCSEFLYEGCTGNNNNFKTSIDCERRCKGAVYMTIKELDSPKFCTLQPDSGTCLGFKNRYYYDINESKCKMFVYGGCGGNQNRFETENQCLEYCINGKDVFDILE